MSMEARPDRPVGRPTLRARLMRSLGGARCARLGHLPHLVERHYTVRIGAPVQIGVARFMDGQTDPVMGSESEERSERVLVCRRCGAPVGD